MSLNKQFDPTKHSIYRPVNIEKYRGKGLPICRSTWELKFCRWLDFNVNVLEWGSECMAIRYFDPVKSKPRTYYPDFYMKTLNKDNTEDKYMIEIKPYKQTIAPRAGRGKKRATLINEHKTWLTNNAKWIAAKSMCEKMNFKFKILTEKNLF